MFEHEHGFIWESLAIMAWLAQQAGSPLWPTAGASQIEMLRWVSWDASFFLPRAGAFYFELYIKKLFGMGEPDEQKLAAATSEFHESAAVLDAHMAERKFALGEHLKIADFCIGSTLLHAEHSSPTRFLHSHSTLARPADGGLCVAQPVAHGVSAMQRQES